MYSVSVILLLTERDGWGGEGGRGWKGWKSDGGSERWMGRGGRRVVSDRKRRERIEMERVGQVKDGMEERCEK